MNYRIGGVVLLASGLSVALGACSSDDSGGVESTSLSDLGPADDDREIGSSDTSENGESPDTGDESAPTFHQDVAPILVYHCGGCHDEGGIGGLDFDEPSLAGALAPLIARVTTEREMPPFLPGPDSMPLLDERRLTDAEIAIIAAWAAAGAPAGDPATASPTEVREETFDLGEPDLTVQIPPEPYAPDGDLADDYRCFAIPVGLDQTKGNIGYRLTPSDQSVVHHAIMFLFDGAMAETFAGLDAETPDRAGWPCFSQTAVAPLGNEPVGLVGWWTPGVLGVAFAEGTARPVRAGSIIVAQMHYNTAAWDGKTANQSKLELFLAPATASASLQPIAGIPFGIQQISIPYGEPEVIHERTFTVEQWTQGQFAKRYPSGEAWAVATRAHMHLLATRFRLTLNRGKEGERILLDIPRWDFHWQSGWQFKEPFAVQNDDTITIQCVYDNTRENRERAGLDPDMDATVTWGEGSADEMCGSGLELVASNPGGANDSTAPECNTLDPTSTPDVPVVKTADPLPTGVGGVVEVGIYDQTEVILHPESGPFGPTNYMERGVVAIDGETWQLAAKETGKDVLHETKSFETNGNQFVWTRSCPSPGVIKGTYTATSESISLYYDGGGGGLSRTLTRRMR
jgi:hypothetical protein